MSQVADAFTKRPEDPAEVIDVQARLPICKPRTLETGLGLRLRRLRTSRRPLSDPCRSVKALLLCSPEGVHSAQCRFQSLQGSDQHCSVLVHSSWEAYLLYYKQRSGMPMTTQVVYRNAELHLLMFLYIESQHNPREKAASTAKTRMFCSGTGLLLRTSNPT